MKKNNENKSIISTIFTEKELAELNFTEEEIADIEEAELICKTADLVPDSEKELDAFYDEVEKLFSSSNNPAEVFEAYKNKINTDKKFAERFLAISTLIDTVEVLPESTTEKVSLSDIKDEKKQEKIDRIKSLLNTLNK